MEHALSTITEEIYSGKWRKFILRTGANPSYVNKVPTGVLLFRRHQNNTRIKGRTPNGGFTNKKKTIIQVKKDENDSEI